MSHPASTRRPFAALALVALGACQCEPLDVVRVGLTGRACNPESGVGIVNGTAVIEAGTVRKETITGGDGRFTFDGLLPGTYKVTVTDAVDSTVVRTFEDVEVTTEALTTMPEDPACSVVPEPPEANVTGQICNRHTGTLVTDAEVTVAIAPDNVVRTTTDAEGRFALTVNPPGEYVLSIVGPGFQRAFLIQVEAGETFVLDLGEGCDPVLASEGGIVGELCDPTGAHDGKLVGAEIVVTSDAGGESVRDITDLSGRFEVNGLTPGSYRVEVIHENIGGSRLYPGIEVSAGTVQTLVVPEECAGTTDVVGSIEGNVCNHDAGGRFTGLADLLQNDELRATVDVQEDGRFTFHQLAPGTYAVRLYYPAGDENEAYVRTISGVVVTAFQTTFVQEDDCPGPDPVCETFINTPEQTNDGRILLVVDKSGSMRDRDNSGEVKWDVMKNALTQTTSALQGQVEFGLLLYPRPNSSSCSAPNANDAIPLALNNASTISAALNLTPGGGTPTAQTMQVARDVVASYVGDGRPLAVVLATDGGPNCAVDSNATDPTCRCSFDAQQGMCLVSNCLNAQPTYDAIGAISALGVKTYVVGVSGVQTFSGYKDVLNRMAEAGGAPLAGEFRYYQAENAAQLEDTLDAITRRVLACRIDVGASVNTAESIQVRVGFNDLPRDTSRQNGWDVTSDGVIELFGSACDTAVASLNSVFVRTCADP